MGATSAAILEDELDRLQRKYNDVLAENITLTAERDQLQSNLEDTEFRLNRLNSKAKALCDRLKQTAYQRKNA
jgi:chromosome segregation ATPase